MRTKDLEKELENTEYNRAKVTLTKIAYQVPAGNEAHFIFAIFTRAVLDCFSKYKQPAHRNAEARLYLRRRPNPHLKLLGIDTEWTANQFKTADTTIMQ